MNDRCDKCGHLLSPRKLPDSVYLTVTQQRIWDAITKWPGMSAQEIMSWVYENDPNGGPECRHNIPVNVYYINKRIRHHGLEICGHGGYRVRAIQ